MSATDVKPGRPGLVGRGLPDLDERAADRWWLFLFTGSLWMIFSIVVFRFDIQSVTTIGWAVGLFCWAAGVNEFLSIGAARGGWKVVRGALGLLFVLIGVVALAYPDRTFAEIAAIFSFFLLFKGILDMAVAFSTRSAVDVWWVPLIVGVVEVLLAFWAAGNFGRESVLLVVWVGAAALARGVLELTLAFRLRSMSEGSGSIVM